MMLCLAVPLLLLFSLSGKALAWDNVSCSETVSPYVSVPVNTTGLNVGRDVAVGAVLATYTVTPSSGGVLTCMTYPVCYSNWPVTYTVKPAASFVSGMSYVYQSNVAGIGYTLNMGGAQFGIGTFSPGTFSSQWCGQQTQLFTYTIQLIKTGTIAAGATVTLPTLSYYAGVNNLLVAQYAPSAATVPVNPIGTCQTPNVTVSLGVAILKNFQGIGKPISTGGQAFNIPLNNCPAGLNSIQYYLTPNTTASSSYTGVVSLDSTSTATGVGVQLLNSAGTAIKFNTNYSLAYSGAGSYTIPMTAQYYQTSSTVTAGAANTSLTFTMVYQ